METETKSEIESFPKIWHIGSPEAEHLFKGPVEITEKIDGSQFSFGKTPEGNFVMRSKGVQIFQDAIPKMFKPTAEFALSVADKLIPGEFIYGESVTSPRHNTLTYARVPKGTYLIFGHKVRDLWISEHCNLANIARVLGCESVPLLYSGEVKEKAQLDALLDTDSILGGEKIEGVVVKNYSQLAVSAWSRECFAKLVREGFKERNGMEHPSKKDTIGAFIDQFKTEARWKKAVQHLKESGELEGSPRDIGKLLKEVQTDLLREEEQTIREALFKMHWKQIAGTSIKGLPEWYKNYLTEKAFSK